MANGNFLSKSPILVVDDMPMMRSLISEVLKNMGYVDILEFGDGEEAWKYLKKNKVELIISDFNMPNMNGIELLRNLKKSDLSSMTHFLLITTQSEEDIIFEALELKADNYLIKPFTPDELKKKIHQISNPITIKKQAL